MDRQRNLVEPHLDLVPSILFQGQRIRVIFNTLYPRPATETFHEFLRAVVLWTIGESWWKHQIRLKPENRHVIVKWKYAFSKMTRRAPQEVRRTTGGMAYLGIPSGPIWALLSLGYDLFCLQAKNALPNFLIERLRKKKEFQAARYEVAAAAIMARAGFENTYLDLGERAEKHCEFIAQHRKTGIQVGVEAKSRVRQGVLHEKGSFSYSGDWRGIANLFRKAKKQKPGGLPFFLFVDVNLPPSPGISPDKKPWLRDIIKASQEIGGSSSQDPSPFNVLIPTNFAFHYGSPTGKLSPPECGFFTLKYPETSLQNVSIENAVLETLGRYHRIPDEV